jgi:hypothetical protein
VLAPFAATAVALALGGSGAMPYGFAGGMVLFEALFQSAWAITRRRA